jgi:hypothetical protein
MNIQQIRSQFVCMVGEVDLRALPVKGDALELPLSFSKLHMRAENSEEQASSSKKRDSISDIWGVILLLFGIRYRRR